MPRRSTLWKAPLLGLCLATAVHAEEPHLVVGLGAHMTGSNAETTMRYIDERRVWALQPVYGLSLGTRGTGYAGAGLAYTWRSAKGWFLRGSVMAGVHRRGNGADLGGPMQFRSGLDLGLTLDRDTDIGIGVDHRSNARIYTTNPGLNSVSLFISRRLN